jgi:hypothetical protein
MSATQCALRTDDPGHHRAITVDLPISHIERQNVGFER